jgi:hypothetical protein
MIYNAKIFDFNHFYYSGYNTEIYKGGTAYPIVSTGATVSFVSGKTNPSCFSTDYTAFDPSFSVEPTYVPLISALTTSIIYSMATVPVYYPNIKAVNLANIFHLRNT